MELSQLTMFKTVADHGSIIRASELLHCVPSNITNRIKLLEKNLGYLCLSGKAEGLLSALPVDYFLGMQTKSCLCARNHKERSILRRRRQDS